jgi:hypothetical protein
MKIAIVGNGPSRDIHKRLHACYDIVIGCNYPDVPVDYSAMVDGYAAVRMRAKAEMNHRLGDFKLILSARCINSLGSFKATPGASMRMNEWIMETGYVEAVITYPEEYTKGEDGQKHFSSGHMAFYWATGEHPGASIDLFGLDSLFTGNHGVTLTRELIRDGKAMERKVFETNVTVDKWMEYWEILLEKQCYTTATFHGYEGDRTPEFRNCRSAVQLWPGEHASG